MLVKDLILALQDCDPYAVIVKSTPVSEWHEVEKVKSRDMWQYPSKANPKAYLFSHPNPKGEPCSLVPVVFLSTKGR